MVTIVRVPLDDDQKVHVAKHCQQEDQLGEELVQQLGHVFEVDRVDALLDYAQSHMQDGKDDRDFHLEGIEENQLHFGAIPGWVDAHWVDAVRVNALSSLRVVTGLEEVQGQRHEIVVHETAEN